MGKELTYKEEFIKFMVEGGILRFGEFTLKSGRLSPYFINTGNYKTGSQISKLGEFYAECIMDNKIKGDAIFGPAYKGIPLAIATGIILNNKFGVDMNYCFDRKEVKDHGEGGKIVGAPVEGKRVLIIDDVITAGTAVRESLSILKNLNAEVIGLVIALNRQEKANNSEISAVAEVERDYGFKVHSIITLETLTKYLADLNRTEDLQKINEYRALYGAK